jgi:Rad3-related DNA helicase
MEEYSRLKDRFSKFANSAFRQCQQEAISAAVKCRKKYCVSELPTGGGKSLIGMTTGAATGDTTYLVHSKALQVQLGGDFAEAPILWGRGNYQCIREGVNEGTMADACSNTKKNRCDEKEDCPYVIAKRIGKESRIRILNYDYFITEANNVGVFSRVQSANKNDIVIVDEADALESLLSGYINIEISERLINRYNISRPRFKTKEAKDGVSSWKAWGYEMIERMAKLLKLLAADIEAFPINLSNAQKAILRSHEQVGGLLKKLKMFVECVDETWLYDEDNKGIRFRPTWITGPMANSVLWEHGDKFLLMSATFHKPHILAKLLGIGLKDIEFHTYPSTFPESSRRVVIRPVAEMVYDKMAEEIPKAINEVKNILATHKNEKGLVHCVSYALRDAIMEIGDPRLMTHGPGDKLDVIDIFKASRHPMVLVSPSSDRGISLDDDLCRFIVWVKAPYLNLKDKLVNARLYSSGRLGQEWYTSSMLLSVVQGCGRGTRSKDDWCVSYLLDRKITDAIGKYPNLVPGWFLDACW